MLVGRMSMISEILVRGSGELFTTIIWSSLFVSIGKIITMATIHLLFLMDKSTITVVHAITMTIMIAIIFLSRIDIKVSPTSVVRDRVSLAVVTRGIGINMISSTASTSSGCILRD